MIKPCGTFVLIKATEVDPQTKGGIYLPEDLTKKEQAAECTGTVVAIGPCAYVGWSGCDQEGRTPAECWGIKVGDVIEHRKYNAANTSVIGMEGYRYIPDVEILGVVE